MGPFDLRHPRSEPDRHRRGLADHQSLQVVETEMVFKRGPLEKIVLQQHEAVLVQCRRLEGLVQVPDLDQEIPSGDVVRRIRNCFLI